MRYTALEILNIAGVEEAEKKFDKIGIRIGGVVVNKPDHIVNVQDSKSLQVIVGKDLFEAKLPKALKDGRTDAVKAALEEKGRIESQKIEERRKGKDTKKG